MNKFLFVGLIVFALVMLSLFFASRRPGDSNQNWASYPRPGTETDQDVVRLLGSGNKIEAIKCYRAVHKVGLKEAKDAVEALGKNLPNNRGM